jgi:hypothetical protein
MASVKPLRAVDDESSMNESFELPVLTGDDEALWTLRVSRAEGSHGLVLTLSDDRGRAWEAEAFDVFEALLKLRRFQLEPAGIQLCCNGARRNAWASTMQREMAAGYAVYLTRLGERGRPPFVRTLDPAPRDECGTVAEQQAFHEQWSAERSPERLAEHSARTKPRWSWLRRR